MSAPKDPEKRKEWLRRQSEAQKGKPRKPHTEESKRKMSESAKKKVFTENHRKNMSEVKMGELNSNWIGGCYQYLHNRIFNLHGIGKTCKICGMTNEEHIRRYGRRLSTHNNLQPKDYTNIEESSWDIVCQEHHPLLENRVS